MNMLLTIIVIIVILWLVGFLVGWVLCFARRRCVNTHTACNSSDFDTRLAPDWQKALEINDSLLY